MKEFVSLELACSVSSYWFLVNMKIFRPRCYPSHNMEFFIEKILPTEKNWVQAEVILYGNFQIYWQCFLPLLQVVFSQNILLVKFSKFSFRGMAHS